VWDGVQSGPFLRAFWSVSGRVMRPVGSASFGARERRLYDVFLSPGRGRIEGAREQGTSVPTVHSLTQRAPSRLGTHFPNQDGDGVRGPSEEAPG
jgi:hypothetical protein